MPNNEDIYAGRLQANNDSLEASRDVTELLPSTTDTQTQKLAELEALLEGKAGHVAKPNIFVQTTEPNKKDGIWLQTDKEVEHYVSDENVFVGGTWTPDINSITIPYKSAPQGAAVVENFIYVFPMYDSANLPYKINVATEEVTNLSAMPRTLNYGIAFAVGTDIYLFDNRGKSVDTPVLKYNTLTDTYSTVSASPQQFNNGKTRGVVKGTDIYLYGNSYDYKQMYKYDTLTDTYTYLSSGGNTYGAAHGALNLVGNQIYIFGADSNDNSVSYKYDIDLNTFSAISASSIKQYGLATITVGNQIYMFGGSTSPFKNVRVYNTTTDTYTNLANSTWPFRNNYAVKIEENVYFLGDNDSSKMRVYHLEDKSYDNNTVVLAQGKTYSVGYNTKLIDTSFESNYQPLYAFADAWFYTSENGLDNTIPTYYGDGTQWIKFKN